MRRRCLINQILKFYLILRALHRVYSFSVQSNLPNDKSALNQKLSNPSPPKKTSAKKNKNIRGNSERAGYTNRSSGIKIKRKRPPKWESEGDLLFLSVNDFGMVDDGRSETETAVDILSNAFDGSNLLDKEEGSIPVDPLSISKQMSSKKLSEVGEDTVASKNTWGKCSVGPILASRLRSSLSMPKPTAIQEEAYEIMVKSVSSSRLKNVVIASPTGTGKTLAYLLPLLSTTQRIKNPSKNNNSGNVSVMIVTPTVDLAYQIQSVVDNLWPPFIKGDEATSSMHVINLKTFKMEEENESLLRRKKEYLLKIKNAQIIAGTPKALQNILVFCKKNRKLSIFSNMQTIVLDEADRLLKTEDAARSYQEKVDMKKKSTNSFKKKKLVAANTKISHTEALLTELESCNVSVNYYTSQQDGSKKSLQIVCASATVGRTLRRQIMRLTDAPSMDKAATLVTADSRGSKDSDLRKNSLLPPTIEHFYTMPKEQGNKQKDEICSDDKEDISDIVIQTIWECMKSLPPKPTLIFPGKTGVKQAQFFFQNNGFSNIQTLKGNEDVSDDELNNSIEKPNASPELASFKLHPSWEKTPVHIVGEKFGRGLDFQDRNGDGEKSGVGYVFLAVPPSSPAAYVHLAGRTGRNGNDGIAITVVNGKKEAKRLVALSNSLSIRFKNLENLK